jgi:hypothetical protein
MNIRVSYQYSRSAKSAAIPSPTYGPERTRTPALGGALTLGTLDDSTEDVWVGGAVTVLCAGTEPEALEGGFALWEAPLADEGDV